MTDSTIFDYLDRVRHRPQFYIKSGTLRELEDCVHGYYAALNNHKIIELCPQLTQSHFLSWLRISKRSMPTGWATAIEHHCPKGQELFDFFFQLVDEYRQLNLVQHLEIQLTGKHEPTRARMKIGLDKKMEKPLHVTVCSYQPAEMYFLLLKYPRGTVVGHIFFDNGTVQTSLQYATQWCQDELQIAAEDWLTIADG